MGAEVEESESVKGISHSNLGYQMEWGLPMRVHTAWQKEMTMLCVVLAEQGEKKG